MLSAADIDLVKPGSPDLQFDLDDNGLVDLEDRRVWVKDMKKTWIGDANLDGPFNSIDLIAVLQAAKYARDEDASWAEGDWSGDLPFDRTDLVAALQDGGYALGPRAAVTAVPEPSCAILLAIGIIGLCRFRKT